MTVLFHDVTFQHNINLLRYRPPGIGFDALLYADDTLCITEDTKTMNKFIKAIEEDSNRLGIKLNKEKCMLLTPNKTANVHYPDGTKVKTQDEVLYLGSYINKKNAPEPELRKRIAASMATLSRLNEFWLHADCDKTFKLTVLNAVVRAKLLYGLESTALTHAQRKRLDTFQLKGLRKILALKSLANRLLKKQKKLKPTSFHIH